MGWRITYTIDYHDRDRDNYARCKTGEAEYAFGETIDDAMISLLDDLKNNNYLDTIISYLIRSEGSVYGCEGYSIDITSVDVISDSSMVDFDNHPLVVELIEKENKIIKDKEDKKKKKDDKNKRLRDLKQLAKLKEQYEK